MSGRSKNRDGERGTLFQLNLLGQTGGRAGRPDARVGPQFEGEHPGRDAIDSRYCARTELVAGFGFQAIRAMRLLPQLATGSR